MGAGHVALPLPLPLALWAAGSLTPSWPGAEPFAGERADVAYSAFVLPTG